MVGRFGVALLVVVVGCGRIGFDLGDDATTDAMLGSGSSGSDALTSDGQPLTCTSIPCTGPTVFLTCGSRCFSYCRDSVTQAAAATRCEAWSGTLVSIHDAAEQACLVALVGSNGGWLGFVQGTPAATAADNWSWLDGTPAPYRSWFANEPSDGNDSVEDGDEQCGAFFGGGSWNDESCTTQLPFMCAR